MQGETGDLFGPTLAEARARTMREARQSKGTHCPCCDKFVKVYRRKFNSGMARGLILVYHWQCAHPGEWLHLRSYQIEQNQYAADVPILCWWGLLEKSVEATVDGQKSSGLYRLTFNGMLFARRELKVYSHAIEYMSNVEGFDGDLINIETALGKHFNYAELMRDAPRE